MNTNVVITTRNVSSSVHRNIFYGKILLLPSSTDTVTYIANYLELQTRLAIRDLIGHFDGIGPWKRDSTYRVHPLGLMDSTYRVPLLDSKLIRLRYAWYYRIKSPSGP